MNLYITRRIEDDKTAGCKAPSDINAICKEMGWYEFPMSFIHREPGRRGRIKAMLKLVPLRQWIACNRQWDDIEETGSKYVLYQHPMYTGTKEAISAICRIHDRQEMKIIVLLHDLESLRHKDQRSREQEDIKLVNTCDYVICHNKRMKDYLAAEGVEPTKIIELGIFDYLAGSTYIVSHRRDNRHGVAVAGNLIPQKSGYIYQLIENNPELHIDLYGGGYQPNKQYINVEYHGRYTPEELPGIITSSYGLVWDGPEIMTCSGEFGDYLRYNNPHKLSLYMAAGMPVVTWKEAAIADFVIKNRVGIVVDSLINLSDVLDKVSDEQYEQMCRNAEIIGQKVRSGSYFRKAIQEIESIEHAQASL